MSIPRKQAWYLIAFVLWISLAVGGISSDQAHATKDSAQVVSKIGYASSPMTQSDADVLRLLGAAGIVLVTGSFFPELWSCSIDE